MYYHHHPHPKNHFEQLKRFVLVSDRQSPTVSLVAPGVVRAALGKNVARQTKIPKARPSWCGSSVIKNTRCWTTDKFANRHDLHPAVLNYPVPTVEQFARGFNTTRGGSANNLLPPLDEGHGNYDANTGGLHKRWYKCVAVLISSATIYDAILTYQHRNRRQRESACYDPSVCVQSGECQGYGDLAGDKVAVRIGTQHSLVRRGKTTRLPTTPVEKASPLVCRLDN